MKIGIIANWLAGIFALAAMIVSYELTLKHVTHSHVARWFESGCSEKPEAGSANCAAVLNSPYSTIPPQFENDSTNQIHVPVAFLGLVYYSMLLIWLLGVGRPSYSRRWLHFLAFLFIASGLCGSGYFIFIMFRYLNEWCPWCMVTHGLNVLIAICMLVMWPRRPSTMHDGPLFAGPTKASVDLVPQSPGAPIMRPPAVVESIAAFPSTSRIVITCLGLIAVVIVNFSYMNTLNAMVNWQQGYNLCLGKLQPYLKDVEQRIRDWEAGKKYPIEIRSDDPIRMRAAGTNSPPPLDVVVFSDFECPMCGKFAGFFDEQVPRLFGGHIREIFKHYPLDQTCNARVGVTMHKHACEAVRMAEAARLLKGNTGFWRAHDDIYKHQNELKQGTLTPEAVAGVIGVDAAAFATAMLSADIQTRINGDADQARVCEIRGTPSIYIDGKLVDSLIAQEIGFWDKLADSYWKKVNLPRPADTLLSAAVPTATTPGSPGSKVAP